MSVHPAGTRWYNAVWRWHFYAGLFCVPFVLWLSITGTVFLWKPQIEAWLERDYDRLAIVAVPASAELQVAAALRAMPGAALHKYQLADAPGHAARVIVARDRIETRVYVDPGTARVLGIIGERDRPLPIVQRLHGELLAGAPGSWLVEIAACWAITMLLTGIYLWWPRGVRGLAGVLYPRLSRGKRLFWRDIHATAGLWASAAAIVLILTGLPWAKAWGGYLGAVRIATGTADGPVDWPTGGRIGNDAMLGDHADHGGMTMAHAAPRTGELDRVVARVAPLNIAVPVLVAPPQADARNWTVTSDAADRPLRTKLTVDGKTGDITSRRDFAGRHWIDRLVGYGIALHEGALFGIANQLLGTLVALLLATLAVSGAILWWRRRASGSLGAPVAVSRPRFGPALIGIVSLLGVAMPMFGATLVAVLLGEHLVLRRVPATRRWLGLRGRGA